VTDSGLEFSTDDSSLQSTVYVHAALPTREYNRGQRPLTARQLALKWELCFFVLGRRLNSEGWRLVKLTAADCLGVCYCAVLTCRPQSREWKVYEAREGYPCHVSRTRRHVDWAQNVSSRWQGCYNIWKESHTDLKHRGSVQHLSGTFFWHCINWCVSVRTAQSAFIMQWVSVSCRYSHSL